ncbi:MAG: hypothetical protein J2P54_19015, partial [Bradyrhizobiaceae bacterium]|nr:hypothetical protein [Bradyrhizobiaceae bacterium]
MSDDGYTRYRKNDTYGRGGSSGPSAHGEDDPLAELARLIGQDHQAPRASPASYEDYQYPSEQQADPRRGYPAHDPYDARQSDSQSFNAYGDEPAYEDDGDTDQDSYEDYEEPLPRRSRRGGLATAVMVLFLAGLGTAGAFAYRSLFRGSADYSPPVIKADAFPNKIVPTNQSSDNTGQAGSGRADFGQSERMVSREERPVNVQSTSSASGGNTAAILAPAPQPAPQGAPPPTKIHTVTIRPDQDPRVASSNGAFPTGSTGARNANPKLGATSDGETPLSLAPQASPPDSSTAHPKLA